MTVLHRLGAVVLIAFILTHLGNHASAIFGFGAYQDYLAAARAVYRHPLVEPVLIALLGFQAMTGLRLAYLSTFREGPRPIVWYAEMLAAAIFLLFIVLHLAAIAVSRFHFGLQTDFFWAASLMSASPMQPIMIAFHFLGAVAVMVHAGFGMKYLFAGLGLSALGRVIMKLFIVLGVVLATLAVAGYTGAFFPVDP